MSFADLIRMLAHRCGLTQRQARLTADTYVDLIRLSVAATGKCHIPEFGTFYEHSAKARSVALPRSSKRAKVPAFKTLKFRASKLVRVKPPESAEDLATGRPGALRAISGGMP